MRAWPSVTLKPREGLPDCERVSAGGLWGSRKAATPCAVLRDVLTFVHPSFIHVAHSFHSAALRRATLHLATRSPAGGTRASLAWGCLKHLTHTLGSPLGHIHVKRGLGVPRHVCVQLYELIPKYFPPTV